MSQTAVGLHISDAMIQDLTRHHPGDVAVNALDGFVAEPADVRADQDLAGITDLLAKGGISIEDVTARVHQHHAARHELEQAAIQSFLTGNADG